MELKERWVALDHLRGFVVALVVLHHTVLAYCRFGHIDHHHYLLSTAPVVDARRWVGFDVLVTLDDAFFMPLLFLLSGLFVWRSLARKGAWPFLRDRVRRLGLPFAAAALTVVPLAYYPSWLQAGGAPGFPAFWVAMVTTGPWPSGPGWFIAVLLVFDAAAALAFAVLGRQSAPGRSGLTPGRGFWLFLAGLLLSYLPLLAAFGPSRWLSAGPFAIQASRIGLYASSFAAGVALGAGASDEDRATFRLALTRCSPGWLLLAGVSGVLMVMTTAASVHGGERLPSWLWLCAYGATLTSFCAAACFALPAVFLRFAERSSPVWGSLAVSSYGIYLLHYPVVTWMQYGLLQAPLGALGKASVTFVVAIAFSWGGAIMLRHARAIASCS